MTKGYTLISHIINVQKSQRKPKIKTTTDRTFLEIVRSQIGSNFNFIASQFEEVDIILFTEDIDDFFIIDKLAQGLVAPQLSVVTDTVMLSICHTWHAKI